MISVCPSTLRENSLIWCHGLGMVVSILVLTLKPGTASPPTLLQMEAQKAKIMGRGKDDLLERAMR